MNKPGIAGTIARVFIRSKLTPLFIIAAFALGAISLLNIPREEEPQIVVPMIDIFVPMPGASAKEVEERVSSPLERLIRNISGVEYTYSTSQPGMGMVTARFYVGQSEDHAVVQIYKVVNGSMDRLPPGASPPIIKVRSINDVPMLTVTLSGPGYGGMQVRMIADEIEAQIKRVDDVSETSIIGGQPRRVNVLFDSAKLASYHLSPASLAQQIQGSNQRNTPVEFAAGSGSQALQAGSYLGSVGDVGNVVVSAQDGRPVFLRDVASVSEGPSEPEDYVLYSPGKSVQNPPQELPAVTITVAKRSGTNATVIAEKIQKRLVEMRGTLIPPNLHVEITRNYGQTANEKSNELLEHLFIATLSVTLLIALTLGWRESGVVLVAIPVTLALTLTLFFLYGYTINRITLFALIFSIGILVDDAIVVVENIVRHFRLPESAGQDFAEIALNAVQEVGNPTILATFAVIAAILPMASVGGLMGPYMRPIPVGASSAMMFSLFVAFAVSPWASLILLKGRASGEGHGSHQEGKLTLRYRRVMAWLIRSRKNSAVFFLFVFALLMLAILFVPLKWVKVKMLPFDNKSEFQIILNMPKGTTLERTTAVAQQMGRRIAQEPEVTNYQVYAGTSAPYNFNGLVRHYFLRHGPEEADIQVNLVERKDRSAQSHAVATRLRPDLQRIADDAGGVVEIAEVPPGPPVQQTLVAEIYGPDYDKQIELARQIKQVFQQTPGVVDVDWFVTAPEQQFNFEIDPQKAATAGLTPAQIAANVQIGVQGQDVGLLHDQRAREDIPIRLRLERQARSSQQAIGDFRLPTPSGAQVSLNELSALRTGAIDQPIYRKNLRPVVYILANVAGAEESPVYAILKLRPAIDKLKAPDGYQITQYSAQLPESTAHYSLKWDGEWQITYEVFRDLGAAFAVVLVLIYVLVVGWFRSFITPLVIMAPIPLTLVGILPAHAMMGAFFTATSMIGFIAGAGIIVRNSIILVDFVEVRRREGMPLADAVIDAGAVRFRPMLLTAAAVVIGSSVILFDPIFQGLAISLMAGEIASTLLSRIAVPVLYYHAQHRMEKSV
ncbi:MAG TPA: efflux RND transporter permease subunit [Acidobacteriaceae bacterium]|nr:efflux RND transporter permease subunit [Acidobacteriaceae bacterium]